MKTIERLVVGLAVGLFAVCEAQAADIPVKTATVEHVKICSVYGAGFYYIPGTDTCLKLGGYTRIDTTLNGNGPFESPSWTGNAGQANRLRNQFVARARQSIDIDTRTATEYGVLRTFYQGTIDFTTGIDTNTSGGTVALPNAIIQFAGFTIGRTISQFDSPWSGYPGNITSFLLGGYDNQTGLNQFAYTASLGSGVTASFSLEDQGTFRSQLANTSAETPALSATGVLGANAYGGVATPDVVGQLRVNQSWGLFQASVAAHDIHAAYYSGTEISGHPADAWGWAGQLALSVRNLPTGPGDTINLSVGYANGASRYIISGVSGNSFAMYGGTSLGRAYQSIAFAGAADGVFAGTSAATGTDILKSDLWGLRGAYTHNWNPSWNTSIFGAFTSASWGARAKALICNAAVRASITGSCDPNFNIAEIGTTTRWTPVKGLTFSAELMWVRLDQNNTGSITLPVIGTKPAAVYELRDQSTVVGGIRAQRNF
jgi:hypothetical protein